MKLWVYEIIYEVMNNENDIWELRGEELYEKKIIEVISATFAVARRKPWKKLGLHGIRTLDLCNTGAALYQLS